MPVKEKTVNRDALVALIKEDDFVAPWNGDVPDGMEIQYVMVREKNASVNDYITEYEYGYDGYGRRTSLKNVKEKGYTLFEITYDDNGRIISKKQSSDGYVGSAPFPNIEFTYKYDDAGRLVSYEENRNGTVSTTDYIYDEDGHLTQINGNGSISYCKFDFETLPYYETCIIVDDSFDLKYPEEVVRYYDENGTVIRESGGGNTVEYVYENGVVTGRTETDDKGTVTTYDADGKSLRAESSDGSKVTVWEYNDHGDNVLYTIIIDGVTDRDIKTEYVYDDAGNMTRSVRTLHYINSEKGEVTTVTTCRYTYDENGLRTSETVEYEAGETDAVTVYYYEAILVPVKE